MDFMLNIDIKKLAQPVTYKDKILLMGSCFTEHIGNALSDLKFSILQNPNGILFGPDAVCNALISYPENRKYSKKDLVYLNEVWYSWQHHSRYAGVNSEEALNLINESQQQAHEFIKNADWLIITLGSSFTYRLTEQADKANNKTGDRVANCHRAPAQWFTKNLEEVQSIISVLEHTLNALIKFNPKLKFIFTISPVRHIRDGVVENNRSKARLIESVHHIVEKFSQAFYFPAYELVIDILRDYRFYDIDLVHPNYAATEFVLDKFSESCIDEESRQLMQEVKRIVIARKHKAFQPDTKAHQQFIISYFEKAKALKEKYPFLKLDEELLYFSET
jgi:hypothetical protein